MSNIDFNMTSQKLKQKLLKLHESDIADMFEQHDEQREKIYLVLGIKVFKNVFTLLNDDVKYAFFNTLNPEQKKSLLKFMDTDDVKDLIDLYSVKEQFNIINLLNEKTQIEVKRLLTYDVDSAGALSSPHFISLNIESSVKEATLFVTSQSKEKDEIDVIFFHDNDYKHMGAMSLQSLIIARSNQHIKQLIHENYPFVYSDEPIEYAIKKIRDYDIEIIPVVDRDLIQVGVITLEDALYFMDEIHTDTIGRLVKVHGLKETDSPLRRSYDRLPWLLASAVLNLLIVSFLAVFQGTLESNIALVLFQPLILAMAGNIGTQSISVIILKLQDTQKVAKKTIYKEFGIGFINGVISGILGIGIVYAFLTILPNQYVDMHLVAITVGLSLFLSMLISAMFGVFIPIVLRKFGMDEKAASGPLITTVNDFFALGIYFLLATLILLA